MQNVTVLHYSHRCAPRCAPLSHPHPCALRSTFLDKKGLIWAQRSDGPQAPERVEEAHTLGETGLNPGINHPERYTTWVCTTWEVHHLGIHPVVHPGIYHCWYTLVYTTVGTPWAIHHRRYTLGYTPQEVHPGMYHPVYAGYVHPVYTLGIPYYIHPGYTLHTSVLTFRAASRRCGVGCHREEALGSKPRLIVKIRRIEASFLPKVWELEGSLCAESPALPMRKEWKIG